MKILRIKPVFRIILTCVFILLITALPGSAAEIDDALAKCAAIKDNNDARLKCFDELANKQPARKEILLESASTVEKVTPQSPKADEKYFSVMEKQWDLRSDKAKERNIFALWPYRPCFFLPLAYISGIVGRFIKSYGLTIAGAITISTFIASMLRAVSLRVSPLLTLLPVAWKPSTSAERRRSASSNDSRVRVDCYATIGQVSNAEHENVVLGKAGRSRHRGIRPINRAMESVNWISLPVPVSMA